MKILSKADLNKVSGGNQDLTEGCESALSILTTTQDLDGNPPIKAVSLMAERCSLEELNIIESKFQKINTIIGLTSRFGHYNTSAYYKNYYNGSNS